MQEQGPRWELNNANRPVLRNEKGRVYRILGPKETIAELNDLTAKAALLDLVLDALPNGPDDVTETYTNWKIEIPKDGYPRQYLVNWVRDYKAAQQKGDAQ